MSDRPTPETDAVLARLVKNKAGNSCDAVVIHHARKLERERDEAREDLEFRRGLYRVQEEYLESEKNTRNTIIAKGLELKKQLDEAREELRLFKHDKKHLCDSHRDKRGNCMVCSMEEAK